MTAGSLSYPRLMDGLWRLLNAGGGGRQRVLDEQPPAEARVLSQVRGPALEMELARRRKTLSVVLLETFPVTYFSFVASEGADGVMRFLESPAWLDRPAQPGSCFPPATSTSAAFAQYLGSNGWAAAQHHWVREAFAFELAYLFRPATPPARAVDGAEVRLADGAWVAEAPFDVPLLGKLLRENGKNDPWFDTLALLKPRPLPTVFLSVPAADRVRRIRLAGEPALELRWIWDASIEVPRGAMDGDVFRRARASGIVVVGPR